SELGRKLRAREVSSCEVIEDCLRRIEAENPRLNAFILVTADEARRQARDADRELAAGNDRGPLHGVPISIKDLVDVRGLPTTAASMRIPAAACGIVGLKPTFGEVSTDGVVPLSRTLDHVGPLARSVADAHVLYRALVGDPSPHAAVAAPLAGLRIAVLRRYFC